MQKLKKRSLKREREWINILLIIDDRDGLIAALRKNDRTYTDLISQPEQLQPA